MGDSPLEIGPSPAEDDINRLDINRRVHDLIQRWRAEDAEEQRETFEFLKLALDEDRPSSRKLFP